MTKSFPVIDVETSQIRTQKSTSYICDYCGDNGTDPYLSCQRECEICDEQCCEDLVVRVLKHVSRLKGLKYPDGHWIDICPDCSLTQKSEWVTYRMDSKILYVVEEESQKYDQALQEAGWVRQPPTDKITTD